MNNTAIIVAGLIFTAAIWAALLWTFPLTP